MLLYVVLGVVIALVVLFSISFIYSFSGTWERVEDPGTSNTAKEKISLGQIGPIVIGRRELVGGYQTFFGIAFMRTIWLRRRDFGADILVRQGFPKEITNQLEGQVFARFKLELSKDKLVLEGEMIPYRIEFTHHPALVTGLYALEPVSRKYRRSELVLVKTVPNMGTIAK